MLQRESLQQALSLTSTRKVNKTFSQVLEVGEYRCLQGGKQW
jgi:hypothetical protein